MSSCFWKLWKQNAKYRKDKQLLTFSNDTKFAPLIKVNIWVTTPQPYYGGSGCIFSCILSFVLMKFLSLQPIKI